TSRARIGTMPSSSISRIASRYSSVASWCSATRRAPLRLRQVNLSAALPSLLVGAPKNALIAQVVESVAGAAPRGLAWRVIREIAATQNAEIDVVREARELRWTSPAEAQWWVRLAPSWTGTEVEHGCTFPDRPDLIAPIRARVLATLTEVKARAESESSQ